MRASLSDFHPDNGGAAGRAGLASAAISAEMVLKISSPVDPVDAGPLVADAIFQDLPYCLQERSCFLLSDPVRELQWVQASQVKSFVSVYIP